MARLDPFRPTVYEPSRVDADDVIAPPYDVVGPRERASLAARSPYNAIHVELPVEGPDELTDPYTAAARLFASWHEDGAVRVHERPAMALYRMTFATEDGGVRTTTGVLGALGLDPAGTGEVLPHEQTTPKDKYDRLSLLRAARTNFSPIWALTLADGFGKACDEAISGAGEPWRATDDEGVLHERWLVDDPGALESLTSLVATTPALIADGHHRYETACTYLEEHPGQPGAEAALAFVVELSEEHLFVQAIHRLVRGVDPSGFAGDLSSWFDVSEGPGDDGRLSDAMIEEGALGLLTTAGSWLLRPTRRLLERAADDLDSSRLQVALADLGLTDVGFQHGVVNCRRALAGGMADAAVLLRPVSVEQIEKTAEGARRMPPKTTFFAPKPRTGMVFRELDPA